MKKLSLFDLYEFKNVYWNVIQNSRPKNISKLEQTTNFKAYDFIFAQIALRKYPMQSNAPPAIIRAGGMLDPTGF
jgi:hypothetical protein